MNHLEQLISNEITNAFVSLYKVELSEAQIQIQKTRKEFTGDLTLVVFPLLKITKKSPPESAKAIGEELIKNSKLITGFNVIQGFLNLEVDSAYWSSFLLSIKEDRKFGFQPPNSAGKMMVEYSSPNTNKPLHLGHLRNNFLGGSVARILEANGHEVIKVQIINDRGIHICKSMLAWQRFGNNETPNSTGLKGDKLVGNYYVKFDQEYKKEIAKLIESGKTEEEAKKEAPILIAAQEMLRKWEAGDKEVNALWQTMNQWVYDGFDITYQTMGVEFDKLYYESDTYLIGKEKVNEHLNHSSFFKKADGSVWINLEEEKLDNKLLLRSDGTSVYMTQDIGTAIIREDEFHCEKYYYVVGNEQDHHFKVLAKILQKMGFEWAQGIEHLSYGMVNLPSGKMKSREGTVVDADDLLLEMRNTAQEISEELGKLEDLSDEDKDKLFWTIGLGAIKYFILRVDPKKSMLFDPSESIDFNGNTGPFIQYTYARIQSILRKNEIVGEIEQPDNHLVTAEDLSVIQTLYEFPQALVDAANQKSPASIASYTYDLVKAFNHFYQNSPQISKEENIILKNFRLLICQKTGDTIMNAMSLLGINVPDRM